MIAEEHMAYRWMEIANPGIRCHLMHPNKNCLGHIYSKFNQVLGRSYKFYLSLYILSFVCFRLRKIKNKADLKTQIKKLIKNYGRSLMFMGTLVCSTAAYTCFSDHINFDQPNINWKMYVWGSFISALSLFCEDRSRRQEIVYFIFVRSARSAYTVLKKRGFPILPRQEETTFALIFGVLSYLYHKNPRFFKNYKIFEKLWGEHC